MMEETSFGHLISKPTNMDEIYSLISAVLATDGYFCGPWPLYVSPTEAGGLKFK